MTRHVGKVHLVGSVPRDTVEEVFETCSRHVGDYLATLPDGEVGEREDYITYQAMRLFDGHQDLETLTRPTLIEGKRKWWHVGGLYDDTWFFRIKEGVKFPHFDDLLYASAAIASYRTFLEMRDSGTIPTDVRFQVSLPPPLSATAWWFFDPADFDRMFYAYLEAMTREVDKIVGAIPATDLAIQWDACWEILDIERALPWAPVGDPWVRFATELLPISMNIPEDALVGYHLCYGDIGHEHSFQPQDLGIAVEMANLLTNNSGRRIDWVHMPVPRHRKDDAYFAPLKRLKVGETRIHLGLVHIADGADGTRDRVVMAQKYLQVFGIATECGFGRRAPETLETLLKIHAEVARTLP